MSIRKVVVRNGLMNKKSSDTKEQIDDLQTTYVWYI